MGGGPRGLEGLRGDHRGVVVPQLAKEHGIRFFETSAKSSENVEEVRGGPCDCTPRFAGMGGPSLLLGGVPKHCPPL